MVIQKRRPVRIRKARQIFRSLADDTRLRIINLLSKKNLNVTELRQILGTTQSNLSKHLTRLRLTGLVNDKRIGLNVYYYLNKPDNKTQEEFVNAIIKGLLKSEAFKKDIKQLKKIKKERK